jgi:predicted nuclease of restriction endonuclease-like (RecB) superfamily
LGTLDTTEYHQWLANIKQQISVAQQRASLKVNRELLMLYWQLGKLFLEQQAEKGWGSKVIDRLAVDLKRAFPELKGFSRANLMYMRAFAQTWPDFIDNPIVQQAVGQIPWGHNLVLLSKVKDGQKRIAYAQKTIEHGWSRNILVHQIESKYLERLGSAITNFDTALPNDQSELAQQALKDPYVFDFLNLGDEANERVIERGLTQPIESEQII